MIMLKDVKEKNLKVQLDSGDGMKVYRVCDKEEIDKILSGVDFKDIGAPGIRYKKEPGEIDLNTHIYDENEMYMHFFPDFKDLFYLNLEEGRYICLYDIPEEILESKREQIIDNAIKTLSKLGIDTSILNLTQANN